jgi:hypothetical protein
MGGYVRWGRPWTYWGSSEAFFRAGSESGVPNSAPRTLKPKKAPCGAYANWGRNHKCSDLVRSTCPRTGLFTRFQPSMSPGPIPPVAPAAPKSGIWVTRSRSDHPLRCGRFDLLPGPFFKEVSDLGREIQNCRYSFQHRQIEKED